MASSIQLLRSTIAQERPFPGNLLEGQPAVNLNSTEPGLFFKAADGSLVKFGPVAITSDGSPPNSIPQGSSGNSVGELWLDKSTDPAVLKVYDGTNWIDAGSGDSGAPGQVSLLRWSALATAGQTVLSGADSTSQQLAYTAGFEEVYVNGAFLRRGVDYSATDGTSILLTTALASNDEITVIAWSTFSVANILVDTENIVDDAITTSKISSSAVTDDKVSPTAEINSAKIAFNAPGIVRTVENKLLETFYVKDYGAIGDGIVNDRLAIQAAINAARDAGGGWVIFEPGKTYRLLTGNPGRPYLTVYSNIGLDLNFSTLTRTGQVGFPYREYPTIENSRAGGNPDENIYIKNGTIAGTGDQPGGTGDQGSAILMFEVENVIIENVKTENTNGDGMAFRAAYNVVIRDCVIGKYGRNGISPTSGSFYYDNLKIVGTPFSTANPGLAFDAENDSSSETGVHVINYIECSNMTFVDFFGSPGGVFGQKVWFNAGKLSGFNALKIVSTAQSTADSFFISSNVSITCNGPSTYCIGINNVSNVHIDGPSLYSGSTSGVPKGIFILGSVSKLKCYNVKTNIVNGFGLSSEASNSFTDSEILGGSLGTVYLSNASSNYFSGSLISTLILNGSAVIGNSFHIPNASVSAIGGALVSNQRFNSWDYNVELNAGIRNMTASGRELSFIGQDSPSANLSYGRIKFLAPSASDAGAEIVGLQVGDANTGELALYTSADSTSGRLEALRLDKDQHTRPGVTDSLNLGTATYKWAQVYAANGSINTSDERLKEQIEQIPNEWLDAWGEVNWSRYKIKSAVAEKGEKARWHIGLIAQRIKEVFENHGIDPFSIGLLCYDKTKDRSDFPDQYGLRYDEALALESAWVRRELANLRKITD